MPVCPNWLEAFTTFKCWLPVTVTHRGEGVSGLAVITTNAPTTGPQTPEAGIWASAGIRSELAAVVVGAGFVTLAREVTVFVDVGGIPSEEGFADVDPHAIRDGNRASPTSAR